MTPAPENTLSIVDRRTGAGYEIPLEDGVAIRSTALRAIRVREEGPGLLAYDPAFLNTAAAKSAITYIDGERGILRHRGYAIEDLAAQASFVEVAALLLDGELPSRETLDRWNRELTDRSILPGFLRGLLEAFPVGAHPMGMFQSAVAALSTVDPGARRVLDPAVRREQILRMIALAPLLAASCHRRWSGRPLVDPDPSRGYVGRFLDMVFRGTRDGAEVDAVLERALETLFILHADHEQNCSANAVRCVGSSRTDPFSAAAAGAAALSGPLHGGANEAVLRMLEEIGSVDRVPDAIRRVKAGEFRLMGFGHRVYKNYDPRARLIQKTADAVFAVTGTSPLLAIARELERIALEDDYFVSRRLYPNVDFYSGIIYRAMGFPPEMFVVLFATARVAGWMAQWQEMLEDPEQRIARPRQIYVGSPARAFVPFARRGSGGGADTGGGAADAGGGAADAGGGAADATGRGGEG